MREKPLCFFSCYFVSIIIFNLISSSMASNSVSNSTSGSPKRLAELLDQQQEPFILEVYLNERGCNKRRSSGYEGVSLGCLFGGRKLSKGSTRNVGLRIAKDLSTKLVFINEKLGMKGCDLKNVGLHKEAAESADRLSSGSFSTEFHSCSESDVEDSAINGSQSRKQLSHQTDEDAADEMVQCSPISVLDEIEMIPNLKRAAEASLWELFVRKSSCWRHMNSKKALQQTRQLPFESHGRPRKARHLIICDRIRCWDKQSVEGKKKILKLLRSDLLSSFKQPHRYHFDAFTEEVVKEVGDRILDEIADEIVHLYLCKSHQISCDS